MSMHTDTETYNGSVCVCVCENKISNHKVYIRNNTLKPVISLETL